MKIIQEKFTNIDFEPEHTIYPQSYLGHTQQLAASFCSDDVVIISIRQCHSISYSTQQESSYVCFKNKESDQLNEICISSLTIYKN